MTTEMTRSLRRGSEGVGVARNARKALMPGAVVDAVFLVSWTERAPSRTGRYPEHFIDWINVPISARGLGIEPMTDGIKLFRASAQGLRGRNELHAFLEHFGKTVLKVDLSPFGGAPLSFEMSIRATSDLAVADGQIPPSLSTHRPSLAEDDDLVLVSLQSGYGEFRHKGRSLEFKPGSAMLTRSGEAAMFAMHTPSRVSNLRIKRSLLEERGVRPDAMAIRSIAQHPSLKLLFSYVHQIADPQLPLEGALSRLACAHVYDLAVMLLTEGTPPAHAIGAARTIAIKQDIRRNSARPDLTSSVVAERVGISTSYLRRLLSECGTSFSELLLEERLQMAKQLLTDPIRSRVPISSIAYDVGFNDLSYFNRCFRRRYGMTPSEVRARR